MKRVALIVSLCLVHFAFCFAQIGTWKAYMSYYEPQQIVKAGNSLFVRASNDLYQYNLNDQSITTYDKISGLSDSYITHIAWSQKARQLILVYQNSNIDLLTVDGDVFNISSLYNKSMTQDKTVNHIYIYEQYAYLCTGFGIVKVNMQRGEIAESYILNHNITAAGISGDSLYLRTKDGSVLAGATSANLIDSHNWTTSTSYPSSVFSIDNSDWDKYIDVVKTLRPGGPKYNYFGFMKFKHNRLYTCGGGYSPAIELSRPGTVQILKDNEWIILQDNLTEVTGWNYIDVDAVDADPADPEHVIAGGRSGVYEFKNSSLSTAFNTHNSLLQTAVTGDAKDYTLVEGLTYDNKGNLWVLNSSTLGLENILEYTNEGKWVSHQQEKLTFYDSKNRKKSLKGMQSAIIDSRNYLWFVNNNWELPSVYCFDPDNNAIINYFTTLVNQDGTSYITYTPYCVVEDLDGNMWIGTNAGPFLLESDRITTPDTYVTQVKVPRNDGTNYADYLMAGAVINCIAIDGGNRKWFGTLGNGVYLISADNMTELLHFTSDNSPLLSDNIESIAIDNSTGEVFIGTDKGLCSYMSDATTASVKMDKDNVYAYPNPVISRYSGNITIVGLSRDADVKILTTNGILVAEGRSNGGTFVWDGKDRNGHRVASGIYMVAAATSDGQKGTVCKIAVIN